MRAGTLADLEPGATPVEEGVGYLRDRSKAEAMLLMNEENVAVELMGGGSPVSLR